MKAVSGWVRYAWIVLLTAGVVIALDQWAKEIVRQNLPKFEPVPVLGQYFMWEHVDNYGAAFGLMQGGGMFFTVVAVIVAIAILVFVRTIPTNRLLIRLLLGLQLGGALGNVVDRLTQGFVTDFIKMGIPGRYYWPNWNIADGAIVTGVIGLAIYVIVDDARTARRAKEAVQSSISSEK